MSIVYRLVIIAAVLVGAYSVVTPRVAALDTPLAAKISPAVQSLQLETNQKSTQYATTVTNTSANPISVTLRAKDFTAADSKGTLALLDKQDAVYGLSSHIRFDQPAATILPGNSQKMTVTINDISGLAAGGHYAAILFEIVGGSTLTDPTKESATLKDSTVSFNQTIASPLFVSTNGQGSYGLNVEPSRVSIAWFKLPKTYDLIFSNVGNVQVAPRGYISINDSSNKQRAKGVINTDSGLVLPGTNRVLTAPIIPISAAHLPGIYTMRTAYRYDGRTTFQYQNERLVYISPDCAWAAATIAILGFGFVMWRNKKLSGLAHLPKRGVG
jgi:hypothetical protein